MFGMEQQEVYRTHRWIITSTKATRKIFNTCKKKVNMKWLRVGWELFETSLVADLFDERQQQHSEQQQKKLMKSEIFNPV